MDSIVVRLRFLSYPHVAAIVLSPEMCERLQVKPRQKVTLSLGKRTATAIVYAEKPQKASNTVSITDTLKQQLRVPHDGPIHLKQEGDVLRIGPLVGILQYGMREATRPVGSRATFMQQLLRAQKGKGVYYFVFSPGDVDWKENLVHGWFLRPDKQHNYVWRKLTTALPDVVYDRVASRAIDRGEMMQACKQRIMGDPHIQMFNGGFLDKWSVHKMLQPLPEVNQFVPETYQLPTIANIRTLLTKYRMVYLKPKSGSLGYGIVKVVRNPGNGYNVSYHQNGVNVKRTFRTISGLHSYVFSARRVSSYLAQQGIELLDYNGSPFDFRVHMHKNLHNEWVVSAMAAKVAGKGSVTTHVRTGGTVVPGEDILAQLFGSGKDIIESRIKGAAIRLAEAIEQAKGKNLGELGLDMGIDVDGHVWMFEANAKPGRSVFKHPRLKAADVHSRRLLVDYSRYLANF